MIGRKKRIVRKKSTVLGGIIRLILLALINGLGSGIGSALVSFLNK